MKRKMLFVIAVFLLMAGVVAATVVNYVSNSLTATVTVQSQCNDGVDNDGDGFCDLATSTCTDGSTPGDAQCLDLCHNEAGNIIQCV